MFSPKKKTFVTLAGATLALSLAACSNGTSDASSGSDFPTEQITILVPFDPGGGTDSITRSVAPHLEEHLGQRVVVENRPGGSGSIATNEILGVDPDGHKILMGAATPLIAGPLFNDVGYVPTDVTAIGRAVAAPNVLIVPTDADYTTAEEFFAAAESGEHVTVGVSSASSMQTVVIELLNENLGTSIEPVPFDGAAGAIAALRAGDVDAVMGTTLDVAAIVKSGDAVVIAATEPDSVPELLAQDVPSFEEQGVEPPTGSDWYGLVGPEGMSDDVIAEWSEALEYALAQDEVVTTLEGLGALPGYLPPAEFGEYIEADWNTYSAVFE